MGIEDDALKVNNVAFFLKDIAFIWWCCRRDDVWRGSERINTWDEFRRELKEQIYPEDAENEARAKLQHFQHKKSHTSRSSKSFFWKFQV